MDPIQPVTPAAPTGSTTSSTTDKSVPQSKTDAFNMALSYAMNPPSVLGGAAGASDDDDDDDGSTLRVQNSTGLALP